MNNFQQKPGFGSLFKNTKKEKDSQPDYRGDACTPKGEQVRLAGWIKKDKNGASYLSLKVEEPREQQDQAPQKPRGRSDMDDSVPF